MKRSICILSIAASAIVLGWAIRSRHSPVVLPERNRAHLELSDGRLFFQAQDPMSPSHDAGGPVPFDGYMIDRRRDGALMARSRIVNGKLNGLSEGWYENGILQVREHFRDGISHGERIKWYNTGATQSVARIENGVIEGVFRRWHPNGALAEELSLHRGIPDGTARRWTAAGRLVAVVKMKDGQVEEGDKRQHVAVSRR